MLRSTEAMFASESHACSSRRMREKYEAEYRELDYSEKQTKERYNQIKAQMTEVEGKWCDKCERQVDAMLIVGENERLQVIVRQKDAEINDVKKVNEGGEVRRNRMRARLDHRCAAEGS